MPREQKIIARAIIQMMGGPKKHIEETLGMYMDKLIEEHKGFRIIKEHRSKAKKEKGQELFNVFSEIEFETQGIESLVWFCFDYMPASVEILEPDKIIYSSDKLTDFLNDLQEKLHRVEMLAKNLTAENKVIKNNGVTLVKNIIMLQLKLGPHDIKTLSDNAGVPEDHIHKFLDVMEKEGKIKKDKDLYRLA
jgi:hypothetical protein